MNTLITLLALFLSGPHQADEWSLDHPKMGYRANDVTYVVHIYRIDVPPDFGYEVTINGKERSPIVLKEKSTTDEKILSILKKWALRNMEAGAYRDDSVITETE